MYIRVKIKNLYYQVNEDVAKQFYLHLIHTLSIISHIDLILFQHYNILSNVLLIKTK